MELLQILGFNETGGRMENDPPGEIPIAPASPIMYHPSWEILDATKLSEFERCPRRFYYAYILGWISDTPNQDLVFGEAGHLAHAIIVKNNSMEALPEAMIAFLDRYRQDFPPDTDSEHNPKTPERMEAALREYMEKYSGERYRILELESVIPVEISGMKFVAKIDAILESEDGESAWVREKKFSKFKYPNWGESWKLRIQPWLYSCVLYERYGKTHNILGIEFDGTFFYAKSTQHERLFVHYGEDELKYLSGMRVKLADEMWKNVEALKNESVENDTFTAFPINSNACMSFNKLCPYFEMCWQCSNPMKFAESQEPPPGFVRKWWNPLEKEKSNE